MLQSPSLIHEVCPEHVRGPSSGLHAKVPVCLRRVAPPESRTVYLNVMPIPGGPSWEAGGIPALQIPQGHTMTWHRNLGIFVVRARRDPLDLLP